MKKELLPADATTIEALYERGDNLTFQWDIPDAMNYIVDLRREDSSGFWIASKTARLELDETCIQFFSDGTLVFSYMANPQKIERFEKIAAKKGFPVKRRLGSFSVKDGYDPSFMYEINCFANRKYHYQTDLIKVPEPEKQDFIDDLFSNGNVCLTACKTEIVDPSYRPYLAVFSDGRFILSADHVRSMGIHDQHKVLDFRNRVHPDFVYLKGRIVPSDWVEEIYRRAAGYDWYSSETEALERYKKSLGAKKIDPREYAEMDAFIRSLFEKAKCLSVLNPEKSYFSPERYNYAVFSDGRLIVDEKNKDFNNADLEKIFKKAYPGLEIKIEKVPSFYIPEIYKCLPKYQKGAAEIYLEMLKQKARALKKMLNIPHHEALEICAKMCGWKNWKAAVHVSEAQARSAVSGEKSKKEMARDFHLDLIEWEYKSYAPKPDK